MCIYLCDASQLSTEPAQSWVLLWLDILLKLCCYLTSTQVKQYCRKLNCVCVCVCVCTYERKQLLSMFDRLATNAFTHIIHTHIKILIKR